MEQYLALLENIKVNGVEKESGRANMPNTVGISHGVIRMDLQEGFPLLTTKKMYWKGIVHELLWILRGETNIKYLVDNNVNIWNGDAYRWYLKFRDANPPIMKDGKEINNFSKIEDFIEVIKSGLGIGHLDVRGQDWFPGYRLGDLGKVYGYQWRRKEKVFNDEQAPDYENRIEIVDQVKECLEGLQKNPYSRYHIIDAWNKADFKEMALPPCHLMYQFIVRPMTATQREDCYAKFNDLNEEQRWEMNPNATDADVHELMDKEDIPRFYLDLNMYQRSCDTVLGVPFNIASMSLLLKIFAHTCNMVEGVATWIGGDTHIYVNHMDAVNEQLSRQPYDLPKMFIKKQLHTLDDILGLTIYDFELVGYKSHPAIKAELFTGLKK
jgi:thymidylate synthase